VKTLVSSLVFALVLALGPVAGSAADPPYPINVVLSLTGGAAFLGTKEAESLHALETYVNANGGINGRPVTFAIHDDQTNAQLSIQLFTQLAAQNVPLIFGPTLTALCQAVMPLVEKNGPVAFCLSPAITPAPNSFQFMGVPAISDVQPVVFRYLKSRNLTRIAMLTSTDASGSDFEKRTDAALALPEFKDFKLLANEHFAITDLTVAAQIARLKATNPDILLTFSVGPSFGTVLRGVHDAGWEVPVYGSGGNFTYAQMAQYAAFLPKELFLNGSRGIVPEPRTTGPVRRAQDAYFAAMKAANIRSEFSTSIPWDPMMLMIDALRHVGTNATSEQLRAYMENLKGWNGIEGTYDFTTHDQRGLGQPSVALFRYDQAKGEFVKAYPLR
jgi:branched-chain amino acid transport system substrate-binding protein